MKAQDDPAFRRVRRVRRLLLVALAVAALGLIHLRSEVEHAKAEDMCTDGVEAFESGVTGAAIACR